MRIPSRIGMAAFALVALVAIVACEPNGRTPGLWLSGEVVEVPVADWSFVDDHQEIFVETRTWYGIPHSVTTTCVAYNGTVYVPSVYFEGEGFPEGRRWNQNVVRDPRVRLKIGERIFERSAVLVEDPAERKAVIEAFARKLSFWRDFLAKPAAEQPEIALLRMDPQ